MRRRQNPFAETGAASSIVGLQTEMGIGIIGDDQTQITPFQRQVFEAEKAREAREKEKAREEAQNGGSSGGRRKNGMSREETVRYESQGEREDDVLEVI